jgi:uncharacterized membrane protein YsdA (DUF1294 family)/cold shock CspA family protein
MRQMGKISSWNDEKGYGFITPIGGGDSVFFHVSSVADRLRPTGSEVVRYELGKDARGRACAIRVVLAARGPQTAEFRSLDRPALIAVTLLGVLIALGVAFGRTPAPVLLVYVAASILSFLLYRADKTAALRGRWRVPEANFHLLALLGGWPGALLAQRMFRHKNRKPEFQAFFWFTVITNLVGLAAYSSPRLWEALLTLFGR